MQQQSEIVEADSRQVMVVAADPAADRESLFQARASLLVESEQTEQ
jgi:hypothetical protein